MPVLGNTQNFRTGKKSSSSSSTNKPAPIVDQTKRSGRGTKDSPLTNVQIQDLNKSGYSEGDVVPGRGRLLPQGYFSDFSGGNNDNQNNVSNKLSTIKTKALKLRDQLNSNVTISSSDSKEVDAERNAANEIQLQRAADPSREALQILDEEINYIDNSLSSDLRGINERFNRIKSDTKNSQANETAQASVGLANMGGYLGGSGSSNGAMRALAQSHRSELADLASRRQQAIAEAESAAYQRRADVVRRKAQEVSRIDQEIYTRQQDYFENQLSLQQEDRQAVQQQINQAERIREQARSDAENAINVFQGLTRDQISPEDQDYIKQIAAESDIPSRVLFQQIENAGEKGVPEKERTRILGLITESSVQGASAEVLNQISNAQSLAEAAAIAQPYIREPVAPVGGGGSAAPQAKLKRSGRLFYNEEDIYDIESTLRTPFPDNPSSDANNNYYTDSETYNEVYNTWRAQGGLDEDFLDQFPVTRWIDPRAENLPSQVQQLRQTAIDRQYGGEQGGGVGGMSSGAAAARNRNSGGNEQSAPKKSGNWFTNLFGGE